MINAKFKAENGLNKKPRIKKTIKGLILKYHQEGLSGPDIKRELHERYGKAIPSLRSIQQIVHDYDNPKTLEEKRAREQFESLDRPWHLGLLRDYPYISAEALRHMLEAQMAMRSYFENLPVNPDDHRITVRQALWAARLYDIVRKHVETDEFFNGFPKKVDPNDPHVLFTVAAAYADYELLCDLAEIPCDTAELDSALSHSIEQFYDFVNKQNTQSLKEKYIIPINKMHEDGHKQPHKMEHWNFVFDPNCPICKEHERSGKWHDLRIEVTRKGVFERQRVKMLTESTKKGVKRNGRAQA